MKVGNLQEAMKIAERSNSALGTVLCYGLSRARVTYRRDDIEKAMEESLLEIIPRLDKRTHYLSSLANIGMLMGLLGTVVGLISAFGAISTANPADKASLLAASISVAMNNTAGGLIVAITLLMSHMFLESKTTALIDSLEIGALKFLNTITERSPGNARPAAAGCSAGSAPRPGAGPRSRLSHEGLQARQARAPPPCAPSWEERAQHRADDRHDGDPGVLPDLHRGVLQDQHPGAQPAVG